jgi:hypothetical protein
LFLSWTVQEAGLNEFIPGRRTSPRFTARSWTTRIYTWEKHFAKVYGKKLDYTNLYLGEALRQGLRQEAGLHEFIPGLGEALRQGLRQEAGLYEFIPGRSTLQRLTERSWTERIYTWEKHFVKVNDKKLG